MSSSLRLFAGVIALGLSAASWAESDRPVHSSGEPSETLQQAVSNLSKYNGELEVLLRQDELSATDVYEVHMLTYTLENAVQKIQQDLQGIAEVLEEVHLASEAGQVELMKERGGIYLNASGPLTQ